MQTPNKAIIVLNDFHERKLFCFIEHLFPFQICIVLVEPSNEMSKVQVHPAFIEEKKIDNLNSTRDAHRCEILNVYNLYDWNVFFFYFRYIYLPFVALTYVEIQVLVAT